MLKWKTGLRIILYIIKKIYKTFEAVYTFETNERAEEITYCSCVIGNNLTVKKPNEPMNGVTDKNDFLPVNVIWGLLMWYTRQFYNLTFLSDWIKVNLRSERVKYF